VRAASQTGTTRFARVKRAIASLIAGDTAGRCIALVFGNRVPFRGMWIDVCEAVPFRNRAMLFWGLYESAECRFIRAHLAPDLPVVECGSGIGAISSVIARGLAPGQQFVCAEGNPRLLSCLRSNIQRHGVHLRVQIVEAAIGSADGKTHFLLASDNLCSQRAEDIAGGDLTEVPCTSLSTILSRRSWPEGWQLIADIEGGEAAILLRDAGSLQQCVRIIIELHDTTFAGEFVGVDRLLALILGLGFSVRARCGNVFVFERLRSNNGSPPPTV
jgi:FkbM family methyltransferase